MGEQELDAVRTLMRWIGADPADPHFVDTPARYLKALAEMTSGPLLDAAVILARQFPAVDCDLVEAEGIRFSSVCPHHLLPYSGTAAIRYRPNERVVGLSKLARLVDALARRPVIQEQLTADLADAVHRRLDPHGVEVVVQARHGCVGCRGVRQPGMTVTTRAARGVVTSGRVAGGPD